MRPAAVLVSLVSLLAGGGAALAAGLPGGATSLNETHGDWVIHCEAPGAGSVDCAIQQQQLDKASGQRLLAAELRPAEGGLAGTLVLPFGLALARGIVLRIDDGATLPLLAFRTCLPVGCLVDLEFAPDALPGLGAGRVLHIEAVADGGAPAPLSLSLSGLGSAVARTLDLLK